MLLIMSVALVSCSGETGAPVDPAPSPALKAPLERETSPLAQSVGALCELDPLDLSLDSDLSEVQADKVYAFLEVGDTGRYAIASHFDKASEEDVPKPWQVTCPDGRSAYLTRAEFTGLRDGSYVASGATSERATAPAGQEPVDDESIFEEPHPAIGASDVECPAPPEDRVSAEQAAQCLHRAWTLYDSELASWYAGPEAVETMFAEPWDGETSWNFDGCSQTSGTASCSWTLDNGASVLMGLGVGPSGRSYVHSVRWDGG